MPTYTTTGSVRGSCGHRHRTVSGAAACLGRDQTDCARQGGYSDRAVYDDAGRWVDIDDDPHPPSCLCLDCRDARQEEED